MHPNATHAEYKNFMASMAGLPILRNLNDNPEASNLVKDYTIFLDNVRSKGYNAIIDENDAGSNWVKSPIILINPADDVASTSTHLLNPLERVIAEALK